jgi:hypothetical protein
MVNQGGKGMSAKNRAAHHLRLAANAIATAMRMINKADQETMLLIAREHLNRAETASLAADRRTAGPQIKSVVQHDRRPVETAGRSPRAVSGRRGRIAEAGRPSKADLSRLGGRNPRRPCRQ